MPVEHADFGIEEPGMVVTPETFEMHLQVLQREMRLTHLGATVDDERGGAVDSTRPAVAITFDDGWRDNYLYAYPLLKKYNAPATIFVVTSLVGSNRGFWPTNLARRLKGRPLSSSLKDIVADELAEFLHAFGGKHSDQRVSWDATLISLAVGACKRFADSQMEAWIERIDSQDASSGRDIVSWEELDEMSASGLVSVESHSVAHQRMTANVTDDVIARELADSRTAIRKRLGIDPQIFCYPNGDYTAKAAEIVSKYYRAAVTTDIGWNHRTGNRFSLRRFSIHEDMASTRDDLMAILY
ncbi:MAG: polysaccharide deacetylase family protein [Steroidobacteraceae bacterium]